MTVLASVNLSADRATVCGGDRPRKQFGVGRRDLRGPGLGHRVPRPTHRRLLAFRIEGVSAAPVSW